MKIKPISDIPLSERILLEEEFYSQPFLLSYSGLNKLLFSPVLFYNHYILKQREDTVDKPMIEGKLLHCLLLNPEDFNKEFVLTSNTLPTDRTKKVMDKLYDCMVAEGREYLIGTCPTEEFLAWIQTYMLDILVEENLHQSLKTDQQRLDKMLTSRNMSYLSYLFEAQRKTVVDQEMYDYATKMVAEIKNNPSIRKIMGMDHDSLDTNMKVHNELDLVMLGLEDYSFGIRCIIDNLVIDYDNKVIRINDLKKTAKSIGIFKESIEYYNYWMQAALYVRLVDNIKQTTFGVDYPCEFRFVVVDPFMQAAPIRIGAESMSKWSSDLDQMLKKAQFHLSNKCFSLPYEFLQETEYEL